MRRSTTLVLLALACGAVAIMGLCAGPSGWYLPWQASDIVTELRAPRVLLAGIVGASLALAGVAMQSLLRNDLADPYVLGLSGGASAGAVASLALWPGVPPGPLAAAGAGGAAALVQWLARGPYDPTRLLLSGVAVSSLLASTTGLVLVMSPEGRLLRGAMFWLFGGVGTPLWSALILPAGLLVFAVGWMLTRSERLDRFTLGSDEAAALGVDVLALRRTILLISVILTAVSVAACGLVGFVGLIAPHVARQLVGQPHRHVIPTAAFGGALLVMSADTVARTVFAPREVPVGLLTATVGGPMFLWLLQRGAR